MPMLQNLTASQINQAIQAAAERTVPLSVTVRRDRTWRNLYSRLLAVRGGYLFIEHPASDDGGPPLEIAPAEKIGLSFKLKHHKHIFAVTVKGLGTLRLGEQGGEVAVLCACWPARMMRLQRRAYVRADVPPNRIVRASFWLGGRDAEPRGTSPATPVWSGRVANLSAGGFQFVPCLADATQTLEVGDLVGVRLVFGAAQEAVYADAQLRHVDHVGEQVAMGFQFVGLGETPEGRDSLQRISEIVAEFQRIAERAGAHAPAAGGVRVEVK